MPADPKPITHILLYPTRNHAWPGKVDNCVYILDVSEADPDDIRPPLAIARTDAHAELIAKAIAPNASIEWP
jgi:hypothetical protein